ncbi:nucleotide pyrophosphohydrolase [Bacteroidota bacterium]
MKAIEELITKIIEFRDARDWEQFHNPKDLAIAINIEAGELLELFLWKDASEADLDKVKEELADVLTFSFLLAHRYNLDIKKIILDKIQLNNKKYPVEKAKGTAKKYNEL